MCSRFFADQHGGVAPIFALALVPMIGLAGAAIDYSRASAARTAMQASLDATTLMIAKDAQLMPSDQVKARAGDLFSAGFGRDDVQSIQVNATVLAACFRSIRWRAARPPRRAARASS